MPNIITTALKPEAFARLCFWITEREKIRRAKDAGRPKPWTADPHLQTARFCNVKRAHDKVSRYLLDTWYADDLLHSRAQIVVNAGMARLINWPDTLEELRAAGQDQNYHSATAHAVLRARSDRGKKVFTGAYKVSGRPGEDKVTTVVGQFDHLFRDHARMIDPTSMQRTHARLQEIPAIGSFMAGQIVADLRYVYPGSWADRDTWAPPGPGSLRGLAWLLGWDGKDQAGVRHYGVEARFQPLMRMLRVELRAIPAVRQVLDRVGAEMHDLQNSLCEFDKLSRLRAGTGNAKNKYPGTR